VTVVLPALFQGPLAPLSGKLVLPDDPRPVLPGSALKDAARMDAVLERFGRTFGPGADRRAVTSLWSKWYFDALIPPVVVASLLLNHGFPLDLDGIGVVLDDDGKAQAIRLPHEGSRIEPEDVFERFAPLTLGHMEPFVEALSIKGRGSPKIFWSNAGNLLENLLRRMRASAMVPEAAMVQGEMLLQARGWPERRSNPLFQPVRYLGQDGIRTRRICCLRYLVPSLEICTSCPLPRNPSAIDACAT